MNNGWSGAGAGGTGNAQRYAGTHPRWWQVLFLWAFMIAGPALLLHQVFAVAVATDQRMLAQQARSDLLREMAAFRSDLEPENQLTRQMRRLVSAHPAIVGTDRAKQYNGHTPDDAPAWQQRLTRHLQVAPLLTLHATSGLATVTVAARDDQFPDYARPSARAARTALAHLCGNDRRGTSAIGQGRKLLTTWLGPHFPKVLPAGAMVPMPTTRFGGVRALVYLHVDRGGPANQVRRAMLIALDPDELPPRALLRHARRHSSTPGCRRGYTRPAPDPAGAGFTERPWGLALLAPMSFAALHHGYPRHASILSRSAERHPHLACSLTGTLPVPRLLVWMPRPLLRSGARRWQGTVHLTLLLIVVGSGLAAAYSVLRQRPWSVGIRTQLLTAIVLVAALPLGLFAVAAWAYLRFDERLDRLLVVDRMVRGLETLERELAGRQNLSTSAFWRFKELVEPQIGSPAAEIDATLDRLQRELVSGVYLFRNDGSEFMRRIEELQVPGGLSTSRTILQGLSARALFTIGAVAATQLTRWAREGLLERRAQTIAQFVDEGEMHSFMRGSGNPVQLRNIGIEGFTLVAFMLRAPPTASPTACATAAQLFFVYNSGQQARSYLERMAGEPRRFHEQYGQYDLRFAIYPAVAGDLSERQNTLCWPPHPVATRAIPGAYGTTSDEEQDNHLLDMLADRCRRTAEGRFIDPGSLTAAPMTAGRLCRTFPYLAVVRARPRFTALRSAENLALGVGVLAYGILIILMATRLIARIFLEPLTTLRDTVSTIARPLGPVETEQTLALIEADQRRFAGQPGLAAEFAQLANGVADMAQGLRERVRMTRFVSDKVLATVRDDTGSGLAPGGVRVNATVMYSDIRGFTTLTEQHAPEEIVTMLNSYFAAMESCIVDGGGTIDRFIGDAILAVFHGLSAEGAAVTPQVERACRAARAMRQRLHAFNDERRRHGLFTIATGIGLATGPVIAGRLGSRQGRLTDTIIGDPLLQAAHLEHLSTHARHTGIILAPATAAALAPQRVTPAVIPEGDTLVGPDHRNEPAYELIDAGEPADSR